MPTVCVAYRPGYRKLTSKVVTSAPMRRMSQGSRGGVAVLVVVGLVFCLPGSLSATTIIFEFHTDRILVLADSHSIKDDYCKIHQLGGKYLFAATGQIEYRPNVSTDPVERWDANLEAVEAYRNASDRDDLDAITKDWGERIRSHFAHFYQVNPVRVRSLAVDGSLIRGLFFGPIKGKLAVRMANIFLSNGYVLLSPITFDVSPYEPREEAYSTHLVTQVLLDGETDSAKCIAKLWSIQMENVPLRDRALRRFEFMIERTADFDKGVHGPVNAAQVTLDGVTWIQRTTCQQSKTEEKPST
jgi:hypothetical protein